MAPTLFVNDIVSFIGEYPVTRKFSDRRIAPFLLMTCAVIYAGLFAFNLLTQGRGEISETFLLSYPQGRNTNCAPASLKLGETVYTVNPANAEDDPKMLGVAKLPGSFQWTIGDISRPTGESVEKVYTGFLYDGDDISCNVTSGSFTYQLQDTNYKYSICGLCLIPTFGFHAKLCTAFDLSTTNLPNFAKKLQESLQNRLGNIDSIYGNLTFETHSLPISAFPPSYNSNQQDLYGNQSFSSKNITQVSLWIGDINFVPSPDQTFSRANIDSDGTHSGKIYIDEGNEPTDFFGAFMTTLNSSSSGFQLSVLGVGGVRPVGSEHDLEALPETVSNIFKESCSTLAWLMNVASADLDHRSIGTTYLCTKIGKKWRPFITLMSIAVGSSSGIFGVVWTLLIFVARKYDTQLIQTEEGIEPRNETDHDLEAGENKQLCSPQASTSPD